MKKALAGMLVLMTMVLFGCGGGSDSSSSPVSGNGVPFEASKLAGKTWQLAATTGNNIQFQLNADGTATTFGFSAPSAPATWSVVNGRIYLIVPTLNNIHFEVAVRSGVVGDTTAINTYMKDSGSINMIDTGNWNYLPNGFINVPNPT